MRVIILSVFLPAFFFSLTFSASSQTPDGFIHTKEGSRIFKKWDMIMSCLGGMHKDRSDTLALSICQCRVDLLDRHFTLRQYKRHSTSEVVDLDALYAEDSLFKQQFKNCYISTGKTILLEAESFSDNFISNCKQMVQKSTEKKLDPAHLDQFCRCQLQLVKSKKLTDAELGTLKDPNSLLFYEVMSTCGDPFLGEDIAENGWTNKSVQDITGPQRDTIHTLTFNGMTYIKVKIGDQVKVWLFDSGATDLLINTEMEDALKKENILTATNYQGTGEYEMANGMVETCRKYLVNGVRIGSYYLDKVIIAVTDKGRKIVVGKGILNRFSIWSLNNRDNTLLLEK
jgi:hypothetical protein